MGIQGLLPFLKCATKPVNIREYSGCSVAIDAYCWLHKGAFSCAEKLARGEHTDQYVLYCMKYVNMLLNNNIKPILVFDGRHLPAKADTEKVRRERRESNRRKAAELLRMDRGNEAKALLQRCVDVTHEMASALIKKCHEGGIDCIVAPFEADAQLAYLNINGFADIVITEDSDLMLFGCKMVLFKMDVLGNGLLVEQEKLPLAMKQHPDQFSMDKFRYMCILSGCDYLSSLPGIGLQKACKFIKRTAETNISRALTRLGAHLNMSNLVVTPEYREKFLMADSMFKYQPVYDPRLRKVVSLTPLPPNQEPPILDKLPTETSFQLALGNLNPFTLERVDDWDPDAELIKSSGWNVSTNKKKSIWSEGFLPRNLKPLKKDPREVSRMTTNGKCIMQPVKIVENKVTPVLEQKKEEISALKEWYNFQPPPAKKACLDLEEDVNTEISEDLSDSLNDSSTFSDELLASLDDILEVDFTPKRKPKDNPFSCTKPLLSKEKLLSRVGSLSKIGRFNKVVPDENVIVKSRFFSDGGSSEFQSPAVETSLKNIVDFEDALNKIINVTPNQENVETLQNENSTTTKESFKTQASRDGDALSPKKGSGCEDLYKNFSIKTNRPSFLGVIDSVSKFINEQENHKKNSPSSFQQSRFKWPKSNKKAKQNKISNFWVKSPDVKSSDFQIQINDTNINNCDPLKDLLNTSDPMQISPKDSSKNNVTKSMLHPGKVVGLKRKSNTLSSQPSILTMFAFQPKSKLKNSDS